MKKRILFLQLLFLFIVSSCRLFPTELPKKPDDFEITWYVDGGMLWRSESIFITKDSCAYNINNNGNKQFVNFTLSQKSLKSLYQVFYKNKFDKIQTYDEDEVYDRGGTSISLDVDDKEFSVSNLGMTFLKKSSKDSYAKIETALKSIAFNEINKYKTPTIIKLDTSITNSKYNVSLYINNEQIYKEIIDGEYVMIEYPLFTMNNEFEIYFNEKKASDFYEKNVYTCNVMLKELKNRQEIKLIVENKILSIE